MYLFDTLSACFCTCIHRWKKINWVSFWGEECRDCGLACAAMVLQAVKKNPTSACPDRIDAPSLPMLTNTCSTKSIWTIDLAYLLCRYGVQVAVTTVHVGANPAYHDYKFYAPNLAQDIHRVNYLFEKASSLGIKVFKRSVDVTQLKSALCSGRFLVIALVDKTKLCQQNSALCASAKRNNGNGADSFTGHFILLYGYDPITDEVCVQDPAGKPDARLPTWQLEIARKTYGTDEDLIFIRIPEFASHEES